MCDRDFADRHLVVHRPAHPELACRNPDHVEVRRRHDEIRAGLSRFGRQRYARETRDLSGIAPVGLFGVMELIPGQERHYVFGTDIHDADQERRAVMRRKRRFGEVGFELGEIPFRLGQTFRYRAGFRAPGNDAVRKERPDAEHKQHHEYLENAHLRLLVLEFGAETHRACAGTAGGKNGFALPEAAGRDVSSDFGFMFEKPC